jgi:N-acetylglucosaminyldiphosphoundecaprenol N-acetyl-beta-D-mannosaminyltransferase
MLLKQINYLNIFNLKLTKVVYSDLINCINETINNNDIIITGCNVNTINLSLSNKRFEKILSEFDIIHPDGIGIYLASRFLYGQKGFSARFTGSDLYSHLIYSAIENNWSFYFFGDKEKTLKLINKNLPKLNVAGFCNGFNYNLNQLINEINNSNPDILIVGLGSPKQEEWIIENKSRLDPKIIIAVGDGIKVFAGIKKRGPRFLQTLGFEWAVRLIFESKRLWKRYIIGIPLFIFRILKLKFISTKD